MIQTLPLTANLTFQANHSVANNLTFDIYIQDTNNTNVLRNSLDFYGNNSNLTWQFPEGRLRHGLDVDKLIKTKVKEKTGYEVKNL